MSVAFTNDVRTIAKALNRSIDDIDSYIDYWQGYVSMENLQAFSPHGLG